MKKRYLYLVIIFTFSIIACNRKSESTNKLKTQPNKNFSVKSKLFKNNDLGKKWLLSFYSDYIRFYINSPNGKEKSKLPLFFNQLDSIKKKNCTLNFYKNQSEDFNKDFDYITNNEFICNQSLASLNINEKKGAKDTYVLSFIAEYPLNEFKSDYKRINFDVTIVKENNSYKISKTCCF